MLILSGRPTGRPWEDRPIDLRVEDHAEPLVELRRLLRYRRAYQAALPADAASYRRALEIAPEIVQFRFLAGVALGREGEWDQALVLLREALAAEPRWRQTLPRMVPAGRVTAELAAEVESRLQAAGV